MLLIGPFNSQAGKHEIALPRKGSETELMIVSKDSTCSLCTISFLTLRRAALVPVILRMITCFTVVSVVTTRNDYDTGCIPPTPRKSNNSIEPPATFKNGRTLWIKTRQSLAQSLSYFEPYPGLFLLNQEIVLGPRHQDPEYSCKSKPTDMVSR